MVTASVRKSAWRVTHRQVGLRLLGKVLNYYKFDANDKRNIVNSYDKYINALSNSSNNQARENARKAAVKLTNTIFKMYEKKTANKSNPVANGITNGVQQSVIYWLPGVLVRRAVRRVVPRKARSAPVSRRSYNSP
jgi:hypothetical protein